MLDNTAGWEYLYGPGAVQQPGFGYPAYPGYPGYPGYPYPPSAGGLLQRVARLELEVDRLARRVAELERRLGPPGGRPTPTENKPPGQQTGQ